jgi:hypothetical protein
VERNYIIHQISFENIKRKRETSRKIRGKKRAA